MCSLRLSCCFFWGNWTYSTVQSDQDILQALKDRAPTKEIVRLKKGVEEVSDATLLEVALKYKNPEETIGFLLNSGIKKPTTADLKNALEHQNTKEVVELLIKQIDNPDLESAIFYAIRSKNSFDVIKLLIDSGAPCKYVCVLAAVDLKASQTIIDLVKEANRQWFEKFKAPHEEKEEEHKQRPKYDYQLILDMRPTTHQAATLAKKANNSGIPTDILSLFKAITKEDMKRVTHRSRVYIIAHGSPGTNKLWGESENGRISITFQNLINIFLMASKLKEAPMNHQRVKISLVVCYGATDGDKGQKSFAEKLSNSLYFEGIRAEVIARKGLSSINRAEMRKRVNSKYHAEGTKFSFITRRKGIIITPIKYGPS
ncbi:MAG TPA: C80 family cysteine peptidase [Rhabdochlamydiaceae bacterium]|nr:C80 family cysteine peptidase [Rhabdochlamydiaceae bacterium]